jgi:hypothetical protein
MGGDLINFEKDDKLCDCKLCSDESFHGIIEYYGINVHFIDWNTYPYDEEEEVVRNAPKFPCEFGAVIDEALLTIIDEWELNARRKGFRLHQNTYLLIALFKSHIGYIVSA